MSQVFAAPPAKRPVVKRTEAQKIYADPSFPVQDQFGLGIYIGMPLALTGKYWLENQTALVFNVSFVVKEYFNVSIDQLWHFPGYFGKKSDFASELSPYLGAGGGLYTWSDSQGPSPWKKRRNTTSVHARFPVGAEWLPHPAWGFFAEVVPGIAIIPGIRFVPELGIGLRFYL